MRPPITHAGLTLVVLLCALRARAAAAPPLQALAQTVGAGQGVYAVAGDGTYPDGVNVEIARIFSGGPVAMRVYERGVGETQACGTGACAVAIAAIELGRAESPVRVTMLGGDVTVEWAGAGENAFLTGGAELVFDTTIDVADEAGVAVEL